MEYDLIDVLLETVMSKAAQGGDVARLQAIVARDNILDIVQRLAKERDMLVALVEGYKQLLESEDEP